MAKRGVGSFFLKWFFGFLLVWLSASLTCVLVLAFGHVPWSGRESIVFGACFIAYFLVHFLLYQPILSHVMAHELTHALATLLMGGKVTAIHATTTGGSTIVNKSHVFISLAPYV
ncbi:MAG TPA: M50 family metallopeptidase, partial [bacterium]